MANIERLKTGYRIVVSAGYSIDGRQLKKTKFWAPAPDMSERQIEKALQREAVLFEEQVRENAYLSGKVKLSEFIEIWLDRYAKEQLKPKTIFWYKTLIPRINAGLGHISLEKLQPHHLLEFYSNLSETGIRGNSKFRAKEDIREMLKEKGYTVHSFSEASGVSEWSLNQVLQGRNVAQTTIEKVAEALGERPLHLFEPYSENDKRLSGSTVRQYHKALSAILGRAVRWGIIKDNPCSRVDPPKMERKPGKFLDVEEASKLLVALEKEDLAHRTMITTLLLTGMRREELLALGWDDVDLKEGYITINKALVYIPKQGISIETTKNESSTRTIKASPIIINLLKLHKKEQKKEKFALGDKWKDSGRIFTRWDGSYLNPDSLSSWFHGFAKRNGFDIHLHSLRHTSATLMISGGLDIRTVSGRLGHSQASTTLNIYSHFIKSADEVASETLDSMLKLKVKENQEQSV